METTATDVKVMKENVSPTKTAEKRKACDDEDPQEASNTDQQVEPLTKRVRLQSTDVLPSVCTAPVLWAADAGVDGKALLVDGERCIVGTLDGRVLFLDHYGELQSQHQLRPQVGAILKDGDFLYAWCHAKNRFVKEKGALYDITGETPLLMYEIEGFGEWVVHAAVVDGCLVVGDDKGNVAMFKAGGKLVWKVEQTDCGSGGFLGADKNGVYFVHKKSVCKYRLASGEKAWTRDVTSASHAFIQNGAMDEGHVYADFNGKVIQVDKESGRVVREFCPLKHRASGVCVGNDLLVTGSCPTVIFNANQGTELFRMNFSGRLQDSVSVIQKDGLLFTFWDKIYCIDLSVMAIKRAVEGRSTRTKFIDIPPPVSYREAQIVLDKRKLKVDDIRHEVLEVKDVDGQVQARCTSAMYHTSWPILFPLPLQFVGHRFVVDKLVPSKLGSFYRVAGPISVYEEGEPSDESSDETESVSTDGKQVEDGKKEDEEEDKAEDQKEEDKVEDKKEEKIEETKEEAKEEVADEKTPSSATE